MKRYLVGGAVRDELLGRPVMDRDWVVVGATPDELLAKGYRQIGNQFPCFLHPKTQDEYALARTEKKTGSGHTGFVCDFSPEISLEEDLSRRDLTINAIAKDIDGQYIDPYGGLNDIEARILRHVSPAFAEDPLRVLRVARFAARLAQDGFTIAPETSVLMKALVASGELAQLTVERVWKEFSRALIEPTPSEFLRVLASVGAMEVVLPELSALCEDAQLLALLDKSRRADDPEISYALLVHRLPTDQIRRLSERLKMPNSYLQLALLVANHHQSCAQLEQLDSDAVVSLLESLDAYRKPDRLRQFAVACSLLFDQPLVASNLTQYRDLTQAVEIEPILEQGLKGRAIAAALRAERVQVLERHR